MRVAGAVDDVVDEQVMWGSTMCIAVDLNLVRRYRDRGLGEHVGHVERGGDPSLDMKRGCGAEKTIARLPRGLPWLCTKREGGGRATIHGQEPREDHSCLAPNCIQTQRTLPR